MKKIAISIGDINGIGIEIALLAHEKISKKCKPIYCINKTMLNKAAKKLNLKIPKKFKTIKMNSDFQINPGKITKESGNFSFNSFQKAIALVEKNKADAICTLPINKEAWGVSNINYKGHTEVLRHYFGKETIMMLGCKKLFVGLFTEHIPLKEVHKKINKLDLFNFLINFYFHTQSKSIGVLGLNPHAGDNGILGNEEIEIKKAINKANKKIGKNIFKGPLVPDIAFTKSTRKNFNHYVCMYHDQGLAPLKTLYFDNSINVSLNKKIIRTSVDHGTAFDIAYKNKKINLKSYTNAIKEALKLIDNKKK